MWTGGCGIGPWRGGGGSGESEREREEREGRNVSSCPELRRERRKRLYLPLETARVVARQAQAGVLVGAEDVEGGQVARGEAARPLGQRVSVVGAQREAVEELLQRAGDLDPPPGRRGERCRRHGGAATEVVWQAVACPSRDGSGGETRRDAARRVESSRAVGLV